MRNQRHVSFLFITYNRSDLLKQALNSLRQAVSRIKLSAEFVVADDASSEEHHQAIEAMGFDRVVIAPVNAGLGANQNRGLAACGGNLIFQVQDDWIFTGEPRALLDAISILELDPEVGIVQLTNVGSDLPTEPRITETGVAYKVFKNDRLPWRRDCGMRPYADQPHVKSGSFVSDLGPYIDGVPMAVTENDFKQRVATQGRWRIAQIAHTPLFIHIGAEHSLNPGGPQNKMVGLLKRFSFLGNGIESVLRASWRKFDHIAALGASRWIP